MILTHPAFYTDFYELTMAQGYFLSGRKNDTASFEYFFRKLPFNGGYVVFAGLADFLEHLMTFRFHEDELEYLRSRSFSEQFLDYLRDFRFSGDIYTAKEGEIIFPHEPIVRVNGNIIEAQIIETLLLNILNFESLIATKSSRIKYVAGDRVVLDFGLRRAQGFGGIQVSKASIIGGLDGTSNVYASLAYDLKVSGTMAHSWIQSFENELIAFRSYAEHYPDSCVLLVDTYNTLKSGIPNAITVAKELEKKGHRLKGIRLDSGDLAYLSKKARKMLDTEGLEYVNIAASNQLDEHLIKSLIDQRAPIDLFGVGTRLATSHDNPALDGVYKLNTVNRRPTLKISENVEKITLPAQKNIIRYLNDDGSFYADGILLTEEHDCTYIYHPHFPLKSSKVDGLHSIPLLSQVVKSGELVSNISSVQQSADYAQNQLIKLNDEHKRFDNPHEYKVGISENLMSLRDSLIKQQY